MQAALVDGKNIISADILARYSLDERASYKGHLSCPDRSCRAVVVFRPQGADGRPAHFYSNEHAPICAAKASVAKCLLDEVERREDEAIWNDASELVLRLDASYSNSVFVANADRTDAVLQGRSNDPLRKKRHSPAISIGLRPLLRRLRDDMVFPIAAMPLTLSDGTRGTVREDCTHVSEYVHSNRRRIVWGEIVRGRDGWIDSGERGDDRPAVLIPKRYLQEVVNRAHAETFDEIVSKNENVFDFIVEGVFGLTRNGTPWVTIEDPGHIAVLARPSIEDYS